MKTSNLSTYATAMLLATFALGGGPAAFAADTPAVEGAMQPANPPAQPIIKNGDVVAVVGDSITEQHLYSLFIEDYLLMCQPAKVQVINFGWGGEQVFQLNARINDVLTFKPTVVTTCYGMNDGHYVPVNDEIRRVYRENTDAMVKTFTDNGAKVIVGSPGAVDTETFKRPTSAADYNVNLASLGGEAKYIAGKYGQIYADVHTPMIDAMAALKAKYGQNFQVAGGDGVHPGGDGHLIMAYAFLKAMGLSGNIGEFDVDLAAHTATATAGHQVLKVDGNTVTIESTRYPFCFQGNPGSNQPRQGEIAATVVTTEVIPFNEDLNRLVLKVTGPAASYKVTWGKGSKTFTAEQLKSGVNLAAQFQDNPFSQPFSSVMGLLMQKQSAETALIKNLMHSLYASKVYLPDQQPAVEQMVAAIKQREQSLADQAAAAVKPITHTITIEAQP